MVLKNQQLTKSSSTRSRGRTGTASRPLVFETSASTDSAIRATGRGSKGRYFCPSLQIRLSGSRRCRAGQAKVGEHAGGDGFHDGRDTQGETHVVPAGNGIVGEPAAGEVEGPLEFADAGSRLESDAEDDRIAVGKPAVDSARVVGFRGDDPVAGRDKAVVVLAAPHPGSGSGSRADP